MLLCCAEGIIVEVIDNKGIAISRKVDVEFEEEGHQGGWCGGCGRECQQNISARVDEIEEKLRGKVWPKS